VKLSLFTADGGRILKDDDPVKKELEKRTNVKLDVQVAPNGEYQNKYSMMVASGTIPDIFKASGFDAFQFMSQGIYMDVEPLLAKNAPNLMKYGSKEEWDMVRYKGKQLAIPYINVAGKLPFAVRQDWLDSLGLKAPTTLDEFTEVAKKFTFNDPDKNGKNDTYALGGPGGNDVYCQAFSFIFGAFGAQPQQYYVKDNKVTVGSLSNEYKAATEYIAQLYKDKVIDPDIFITKDDQGYQKIAQGKIGFVNYWWSTVPAIAMTQLKMDQLVPGVKWSVIDPVKGKDGKYGQKSYGSIGGTDTISVKCKYPEAALKFLDYLSTREGWELAGYGLKGEHYTEPGVMTPAGQKAKDEKWLDMYSQIVNRPDWQYEVQQKTAPLNWPYLDGAQKAKLYNDDFYGITTKEYATNWAEVKKVEIDWFIKFVTGAEPISKWDEYVKQWNAKGGKEMLDSMTKEYNARKGTNVATN
jgi:putative aldouronate transport system substrate-binding protein